MMNLQQCQLAWMLNAVNLGLVLIDEDEKIVYWNDWIEKKSGISAELARGKTLESLFPEIRNSRLASAIRLALRNSYPSMLSQALNRSPLPLYEQIDSQKPGLRIQQAIQVLPNKFYCESTEKNHCLIQIADVTTSVEREKLLWEQADRLRAFSHIDGLTGVPNRRRFDEYLATEFRRAIRTHQPLSMILIDVDDFKAYNDNLGHLAGDACLIQVFTTIRNALRRPADLAARYGGEEMAVILPETDEEGAASLAEELRRSVEALEIAHPLSRVGPVVTVSLGTGCFDPMQKSTINELIMASDRALYAAKHSGRNRVCTSQDG